jgi:integrase
MPKVRLNDKRVATLEGPAPGNKQVLYWDDRLTGFGVRVTATSRTFVAETRVKGKTCRVSIGKFGPLSCTDARDSAKKLLGQMAGGSDPNKVKAAERARAITLGEAFEDYKRRKLLRPKTIQVYDGAFERCLKDWSDKQMTAISADMVEQKYSRLLQHDWKSGRGGKAQISQAMRLLSCLFNFAMNVYEDSDGRPVILRSPVRRLSQVRKGWSKCPRRQGVLRDTDLSPFYRALSRLSSETAKDYLLFLLLTGLRRNEAAGLRWNEIDLENESFTIPGERTKNHQPHGLPMPSFLVRMLHRRASSNVSASQFVFPGFRENSNGHYTEPKSAYQRVGKSMGKHFSPHDLRRTFITVAERLHIDRYALKSLLNHTDESDVTAGYVITEIERLREPMNQVTAFILEKMGADEPDPGPSNVIHLSMKAPNSEVV